MYEIPTKFKSKKQTLLDRVIDSSITQLSNWKNRKEFRKLRSIDADYTECSLKGFDEHECIFIHIPKTAGISINRELFGSLGGAHRTVRSYKRIFGPHTFKRYFKFTFVRNPYSRLLSAYLFLKKGGVCNKDRIWAEQNIAQYDTFNDFVHDWLTEHSIQEYIHFKPQHIFICDRSLEPEVDYIGRFETISEDFNNICNILDVNCKLHKYNQGPEKKVPWYSFYSEAMLKKVYQIYYKDFELFKYKAQLT